MLHEQLRTFHGCRQHKFAITAPLYHNTQYFSIAASNIKLNDTQRRQVFSVLTATVRIRSRHNVKLDVKCLSYSFIITDFVGISK